MKEKQYVNIYLIQGKEKKIGQHKSYSEAIKASINSLLSKFYIRTEPIEAENDR